MCIRDSRQTVRIDVIDRQITMSTLERDDERVAHLAHRNVVRERPRRYPGLEIEYRIDIDRGAVRIQDRADRLEQFQRRCAVPDGLADDQVKFTTLVLNQE